VPRPGTSVPHSGTTRDFLCWRPGSTRPRSPPLWASTRRPSSAVSPGECRNANTAGTSPDLLGRHEYDLWPDLPGAGAPEIRATYPHRAPSPETCGAGCSSQPSTRSASSPTLACSSPRTSTSCGRSPQKPAAVSRPRAARRPGLPARRRARSRRRDRRRDVGEDPQRDRPLPATTANPGVGIRLHTTVLYNSIYRADDELLVNVDSRRTRPGPEPLPGHTRRPHHHLPGQLRPRMAPRHTTQHLD
jgi:hypothetical protein